MTKTSKIKLVVTSALVLGAVATIGGTYAALTLSGGNKTQDVNDGINISDVVIQNNVVNLAASVKEGVLDVDGYEDLTDNNIGQVDGDAKNDRTFSLGLSVTGNPESWASVTVTVKISDETYLTLSNKTITVAKESLDPAWAQEGEGEGVDTVKTCTLPITLEWASKYQGGFLKWVNTTYPDGNGAWDAMEAFQTAINSTTITCTVTVQLASGAGA
ncbi:MAG: hypothetical protein IAC61_00655 [Firmicutes bacterium]|uniref:Uncharacterized protein n=1 Tax=Candidatus Alloenteromonas pullistercoris TaxID=2840785 RepID=A0A9D9DDN8_9FIRM|nr:hypothetical protein [Candidatus Enteromonas pullistercoris]